MRTSISLNGIWEWNVSGCNKQYIRVPSCYHCVGDSFYEREIIIDEPVSRTILRFEGIHYEGNLWFNDVDMGEILPYTRFEFNITTFVIKGVNKIKVLVKDITSEFGPTGGWESYGGISRDVFLDLYTGAYISDTQWITRFDDSYKIAYCTLRLFVENPGNIQINGDVGFCLSYQGQKYKEEFITINANTGETQFEFNFIAESPLLWDCDLPHLYNLSAFLRKNGEIIDEHFEYVGFREFKAAGSRFILNGRDTTLKGVCRHEMWGEHQGFSLTKEQIDKDFLLIKQMGANYVRLVHYPHDAYTMEVCDRLGIMVSEEPGLWWSDFRQGRIAEKAVNIMERTVKRDRNRPSVIFWLLFNECFFAGNYPYEARIACRNLDPSRMVSAANCMPLEETKAYFNEQELDFYTYHAYGHQTTLISDKPLSIDNVCSVLNDKPLVFTEWGGWYIHNNRNLIDQFKEEISRLSHNRAPLPNLAGISWWQWQDIYEFNRGLPGVIDGVLCDGLVDINRNVKFMYQHMAGIFRTMDEPFRRECVIEVYEPGYTLQNKKVKTLSLCGILEDQKQKDAWLFALANPNHPRRVSHNRYNKDNMGPVMPYGVRSIGKLTVDIQEGRPVIFTKSYAEAELIVDEYVSSFYVIGHITYCEGYPITGKIGDPVMNYELTYDDGEMEIHELKNGYDFSSSSLLSDASRINPVTANTDRLLNIKWDNNWEVYQVCCEVFNCNGLKKLKSIKFKSAMSEDAPDYPLLYGVTAVIA